MGPFEHLDEVFGMAASTPPGQSEQLPDAEFVEYSVVIPVYSSAESLPVLHERLATVMERISPHYEIIFVDDASPDDAWTLIEQFRSEDSRVRAIQHMRNFGQQLAILSGLRHVRGQYVITMDDDLQHPPEEILKLVDAITRREDVDAVIGAYETKRHSWFRNVGSSALNRITSFIFRVDPGLQLTSFRIIRRVVVDEMLEITAQCTRISHLLLMTTNRLANVPVSHSPREHGRSGYGPGRLVSNALDTILTNSALPLQLMSLIGFGSSFVSFLVALYYLGRYLSVGISVPGWTSTILVLLFLGGALLFCFGVVGEYLIRILRELRGAPHCAIRKREL